MRKPQKPYKPIKPTEPCKPSKIYNQNVSCILSDNFIYSSINLSDIINEVPDGVSFDNVSVRIESDIDYIDQYADIKLYLDYPEPTEMSEQLYQDSWEKYNKQMRKYHKDLIKYNTALEEWKVKEKKYQEQYVLWAKEQREKEIETLEKRLNKLKRAK